ncbi:MAG: Glu-tRNA(Gln) amidotransferase subunit GatD [Candidatus Marsarchaeota archaeon]|nr:Glu-tRNA(Gln) amidotransferase subunit GatD [Candidatus Marsarchaeota archaeon]MCL5412970.1 Glu-tRNA(Gln) amidotransferase subunit GatD [Candidatus Marsarchaeota archaeon]
MYSKELIDLFKGLGINIGDAVRVSGSGDVQEGILMPRADVGDSDVIVIKRKDGYNIGIRFNKESRIERVSPGHPGNFLFPKLDTGTNKSLKPIAMLYTGGTIGSKVDYVSGGVYMLTKPEELLSEVPELQDIANIDISNLMSIASEDMTYVEWQKIAEKAADALNKGANGIVITHGTDTMHYTSAALSFMLKGLNAPVVLTGAQRSSDRGSSDAFMNLICSAYAASRSDIAEVGVCMHSASSDSTDSFIRGTKVRKMHTSRRDAFRPVNNLPICEIDIKGNIRYLSEYKKVSEEKKKVELVSGFEPKVALIKAYPNSDPEVIDYYLGKGYKGIVLEGTGLGHVPSSPSIRELSWISHVKSAVDFGMVVGATSQCIYGRVNESVYRNLRLLHGAGAIYCEDMLPEVAYVKLGFLLGNYGADKAKRMLNANIAGEITERTELDFAME